MPRLEEETRESSLPLLAPNGFLDPLHGEEQGGLSHEARIVTLCVTIPLRDSRLEQRRNAAPPTPAQCRILGVDAAR